MIFDQQICLFEDNFFGSVFNNTIMVTEIIIHVL